MFFVWLDLPHVEHTHSVMMKPRLRCCYESLEFASDAAVFKMSLHGGSRRRRDRPVSMRRDEEGRHKTARDGVNIV